MFSEKRLREIVAEHLDGRQDHGYRIWTLLMLELWFRMFVDAEAAEEPLALAVT